MDALGHVVLDEEVRKSIVQLPTSPVPMMMLGTVRLFQLPLRGSQAHLPLFCRYCSARP